MSVDHLFNLDQRFSDLTDPLKSVAGANAEPMTLWVPSEAISLHSVDIPTAPQRKWAELLPWMLEDRVLQPVGEMHFVVAGRDDEKIQIMAVSRQDMLEWIRVAENAGVSAQAMAPDFMALPWESGILSIGWRDGILLVRQSSNDGFAATPEVAWALVDSILNDTSAPPRLSISLPDASMVPEHLRDGADINNSTVDWEFAHFPAVNLMTGDFKPKAQETAWTFWWPTAASAAVLLFILVGYFQIASKDLERQIESREKVYVTSYSQLFSGPKPKPSSIKDLAEAKIEQLFKQQQSLQATPIAALAALDSIMIACQCELKSINVDGEGLEMKVTNGAKLTKKSLNIPGYQTSLRQEQQDNSQLFVLSIRPVVKGRSN